LNENPADDTLARRVRQFLEGLKLAVVRRVRVGAQDGGVTVEGSVRSFYERQLVIACIKRVAEVRHVVDRIEVQDYSLPLTIPTSQLADSLS
jgi:osmotically-inducible protein OsmY